MQEPAKGIGDADRDRLGVNSFTEESSDGGDGNVSFCTGVEAPEDCALSKLASDKDCSSTAPSVERATRVLFIVGDDLEFPNCANH